MNYLLAEKGYSKATVLTYRASLTDLWRFCQRLDEQLTWERLDKDVLRRWMMADMEQGVTARTVNRKMSSVRSFYRYLLRMQRVTVDPTETLKNPKIQMVPQKPKFLLLLPFLKPRRIAEIAELQQEKLMTISTQHCKQE